MRWNLLLAVLIPFLLSACASKKHASSGRHDRDQPSPRSHSRDQPAPQPRGNNDTEEYIRLYSSLAIEEMRRSGIPASITLAQGILESGNGNSRLARQANNHFGIKCTSDWKGGKTYKDDDRRNECFRVYPSAKDSYRDHTEFLKRQRYRFLFDLNPTDYKAWARGLKKAGYATNPRYPQLLIGLIERYELYYFDRPQRKDREKVLVRNNENTEDASPSPPVQADAGKAVADPSSGQLSTAPGVPAGTTVGENPKSAAGAADNTLQTTSHYYYTVKQGDTLYAISKRFNITVDELKEWNGLLSNAISTGQQLRVSR